MNPENRAYVDLARIVERTKSNILLAANRELARMSVTIDGYARRVQPERRAKRKFDSLYAFFRDNRASAIALTFGEVEEIIGSALCETAYKSPHYWSRSGRSGGYSRIGDCWEANGYKLADLDLDAKRAAFERI
jgi:hypothetical protein